MAKNVISIEIAMLKRPSRQQLDCHKLTIDQHSCRQSDDAQQHLSSLLPFMAAAKNQGRNLPWYFFISLRHDLIGRHPLPHAKQIEFAGRHFDPILIAGQRTGGDQGDHIIF